MSKRHKIEINLDGIVQNLGIHDASIVEIKTIAEGENISSIVRCRSEDGTDFVFNMEEVRLFNVSFFGLQNIISDCILITSKDAHEFISDIKDLEKYTFERYEGLNDLIKKGELALLRLIPSVGAEINCICKSVTLSAD